MISYIQINPIPEPPKLFVSSTEVQTPSKSPILAIHNMSKCCLCIAEDLRLNGMAVWLDCVLAAQLPVHVCRFVQAEGGGHGQLIVYFVVSVQFGLN